MAERNEEQRDPDAVVGDVPRVIGVDTVALFDPQDGRVVHVHQITTFEGAERRRPEEQLKAAMEAAQRLGQDVEKLEALHAPDFQPGRSGFRVDLENRRLMEMPPRAKRSQGARP